MKEHNDRIIRCPKLGDEVNFKYCRVVNNQLPCGWIVGCWRMRMDINHFLASHYSMEQLDQIFAPPKPKIQTLLELIEQSKKFLKASS